jgi:hypothetical protein
MDEPARPSSYRDASRVRDERRQLLRAVLEFQRAFYMTWGRWPTAEEVAHEVEGAG